MDTRHKRNIKPFNGEKYAIWKFRVKALLGELEVVNVVDGEIPAEPTAAWLKKERNCSEYHD